MEVANAFVKHYYEMRSTNPQALAGLYQPVSTCCVEKQTCTGSEQIIACFTVAKKKPS